MFCRFCATSNEAGATHCRACSAPLPPQEATLPTTQPSPPSSAAPATASAAPTAPTAWNTPAVWNSPASAPSPARPVAPGTRASYSGGLVEHSERERTLAQVVISRGGALGEAEAARYVEAVARSLASHLAQSNAPRDLSPERIVVRPDGSLELRVEWQQVGASRRDAEALLGRQLEALSDSLQGRAPALPSTGSSAAPGQSHPRANETATSANSTGAARPGAPYGDPAARARMEKVGFFDTARDLVRLALTPLSVPPPPSRTASAPPASRSATSTSAPSSSSLPPTASNAASAASQPQPRPGEAATSATSSTAVASTSASAPAVKAAVKTAAPIAVVSPGPVSAGPLDFEKAKAVAVRSWARGKSFARIAWGRDGREVWTLEEEGALSVWSVQTGTCGARMDARFRGATVCSVAFLARDEMVATGHEDGRLCLWLPRGNRLRASLEAHAGRASALCFSSGHGRSTLYSGGGDATLKAWDTLEGRASGSEVEVGLLNVRQSAASPEGERVALGGDGGRIEVWRHAAARLEWHSQMHEFWITALSFSPDGRVLASGGYDRALRLWSSASGALGREFRVHESFVSAIAWSPDGEWLFSLSVDGALWMHDWKRSKSRLLMQEGNGQSALHDFALHPDGRHFSCASPEGLTLWRLE